MHIVKLLVTVSVLTLGASPLLAQRADNPAQADAREKLREAESQLDNQQGIPPTTAPTSPAPVPQQPPPAAVTQPVPPAYQPPPVAPQPVTPPSVSAPRSTKMSPEMEQQLRDQLHQAEAQAQLGGQEPSAPATPQNAAPVAKVKATKPVKNATAPTKVVNSDQWIVAQPTPTVIAPGKNPKVQNMTGSVYAPVPTMLSGTKDQQLADLLQLYKSDKITPAEYHAQRAKILAQP